MNNGIGFYNIFLQFTPLFAASPSFHLKAFIHPASAATIYRIGRQSLSSNFAETV